MKTILNWLLHWPKDKVLHFALALIIALVAGCVAKVCGAGRYEVLAAGWFAGFIACIGKEIYDEYKDGDWFDTKDLIADGVGLVLAELYIITLIL